MNIKDQKHSGLFLVFGSQMIHMALEKNGFHEPEGINWMTYFFAVVAYNYRTGDGTYKNVDILREQSWIYL